MKGIAAVLLLIVAALVVSQGAIGQSVFLLPEVGGGPRTAGTCSPASVLLVNTGVNLLVNTGINMLVQAGACGTSVLLVDTGSALLVNTGVKMLVQ